jgi:arsenate reductase (glutaredoxin)
MYKIYHNPRCKKSRAGLKFLEDHNLSFEVKRYLDESIDAQELKTIFSKMGVKASDMIRTQEEVYKKEFKGKNLTDDEWIAAIVAHPKLLKRPIVIHNDQAVWGDPAENIQSIVD